MKQTAVEYLIQEIEQLITISTFQKWVDLKEKAKAMEKEQIKKAYKSCYTPLSFGKIGDLDEDFKEWFEQFKKENKQ